jgi:ParB/RepB/Spo0J family partition protein
MTTETQDNPITANDPEAGSHVRLREHLTIPAGGPDKHAGMYGTIAGRDPFGGYLIKVGAKTMHYSREDFLVVAEPSADQLASALLRDEIASFTTAPGALPAATHPQGAVAQLLNEPPLAAINSPTNPRKRRGLDIDSLRSMADSIKAHGLMQPIVVRPLPWERLEETAGMDPRPAYEVIAGERRWRAAQLAELADMPMLLRHLSDEAVLEIQLVENIEREDLDPMEEAEGFALLRDKLGYTVDQIAERMGKGRGPSYVRKRMKLLDLTPASRDAMFEGTLQLSTGLVVAKYPAEIQAKAVKIIKGMASKGADGQPVPAPFRTVVLELYRKLNTILKTAAFDTQDPGLVMTAGPCSTCPKRTRADQDLFAESTDAGEDSCLDSACWEAKKTAHVQRIRADAQARGLQVMDEHDAAKAAPSPYSSFIYGYTRLNETAYTETGNDGEERQVTYADALRAQGRKAPKPIVFINPHTSKAEEVIPDDLADKLRPVVEREATPPPEPTPVPEEHRALKHQDVRRALFYRLFDSVRSRPRTVEDLRMAAIAIMCQTDDAHIHVEAFMGWSESVDADDPEEYLREKIESLDADQLGQVITMAAMEQALDWYTGHLRTVEQGADFFQAQGIDILAVRNKVLEDLERQAAHSADEGEGDPDEYAEEDGDDDEGEPA